MGAVYELVLLVLFCDLMPLVLAGGGYQAEGECPSSFNCGNIDKISFPFTKTESKHCGLFPIKNCDEPTKPKMIQLQDQGKWNFLLQVVQLQVLPKPKPFTVFQFRDDNLYELLQSRNCQVFRNNYSLPCSSPFATFHIEYDTTLFRCNRTFYVKPPTNMLNFTNCSDCNLYYKGFSTGITADDASVSSACTKVQLPIRDVPDAQDPFTFITADIFIVVNITDDCFNCHYIQGGRCQLDSKHRFYCANAVKKKKGLRLRAKLGIALTLMAAGVAVLMVLACCCKTKIFSATYVMFWRENPSHQIIEEFLKEHEPLPAVRYRYSEVKKITNSFRNKLGQGGYGSVYKGKLHDGRVVAVKILSKSKGDGQEFINEVASISKTSHVNIVRLLGFCLNGSQRALIYEFMQNGSLEKFIYEDKNPLQLDYNTLFDIAIGVARGLEYLHRGCNTRILHFDIKPHNILLDEGFSPKISDFGLAKICPKRQSIISICEARGTVGYIAPELFSRNFGSISHKSDVYSYGMMVLEMVGSRKNINIEVDHSSEIYFPHWIYNRLESNHKLGLQSIRNKSDEEKVRKMTITGLWCIQTDPSTRPAISKVVEMLEGRLELLQMPPKPFLSSPSISPIHLSSERL